MTLLERIISYAKPNRTSPEGLRILRIEVGSCCMERLAEELRDATGVDLGARPARFRYKGVLITHDPRTGTDRIDATWQHVLLTQPGGPLA